MKTNLPMKTTQRLIIILAIAAVWTIASTGCNTMHGVGRDVERTGEHIERAAERAR